MDKRQSLVVTDFENFKDVIDFISKENSIEIQYVANRVAKIEKISRDTSRMRLNYWWLGKSNPNWNKLGSFFEATGYRLVLEPIDKE